MISSLLCARLNGTTMTLAVAILPGSDPIASAQRWLESFDSSLTLLEVTVKYRVS